MVKKLLERLTKTNSKQQIKWSLEFKELRVKVIKRKGDKLYVK